MLQTCNTLFFSNRFLKQISITKKILFPSKSHLLLFPSLLNNGSIEDFSTMKASSPSYSPPSSPSYSPPSSPPPLPSSPPFTSSPQSKLLHSNSPPRNPYLDPSSPPPPEVSYYKRVADKRRKIETRRNQSILHGFDLQPTATSLLHSNGVLQLQNFINELTKVPLKKRDHKKKLLKSLAFHYPSSFSLKLANLLLTQPLIHIRSEVVSLLCETLTEIHGNDYRKISGLMLVEIKSPILESFKNEVEEALLLPLSQTIANVASRIYGFPLGGWLELLEYVVSCVSLNSNDEDSVLKQRKGLMLLGELSSDVIESREFWKKHYMDLYENLVVLMLDETAKENFQNLTFNALLTLMGMSQALAEFEIGGHILLLLLGFIDRNSREETVLTRVQDLGDFISLDVDEVIDGKEENMFQSFLRIAEKEDASEELRCAAVQVIKELDEKNVYAVAQVMREISDVDARRILKVSLVMMSSIEDDPLWSESNEESWAGISQSFALGRFLISCLCFEADGSMIVPMAIEFLKTSYSDSKNWRKRHAGMTLIAAFSERQKNDVVKCFVEFENLVMKSLNDGHHRVVWAAVNAMKWLGEYKLIPHDKCQYHMKFFAKLVSIVKSIHCSKVQVKAIIAIRTLAINCCLDKMASFGEEIVIVMLELLKNDQAKIKEEAVETLESIAALIPTNFQKYYSRTMESLKAIMDNDQNKPSFLLHAKSLECMSSILSRTENTKAKFRQRDVVNVMNHLIWLDRNLSSTDYLVRNHILKALDQFCRLPGVDVSRHFNNLLPVLIRSSKDDFDSCLDENGRIHVLNILSHLSVRSMEVFYPHVGRVARIFAECLTCSSSETRKVSASGVPNLLICTYSVDTNDLTQGCILFILVHALVKALHKETNGSVRIIMLKMLPQCISICGSFFSTILIKKIVKVIKHILSTWFNKHRAQAGSLGENEDLPDEEIIQGVKLLIITAAETLNDRLSPFLDDILSNVALLWCNDFPDRAKAIAIAIFNVIVPLFPDKLQMFHGIYTYQLLKAKDKSLQAQWETARGIGICAEYGGHNFGTIVNVAISKLYCLIEDGRSMMGEETEDGAKISDMAVSALGKICEFHCEDIDDPQVFRSWLNYLPLTNDAQEARKVHAKLSQLLQMKDVNILGPNKENLPKIITILRAILFRSDELVTEETFSEILDFMDKHGGGFL